MSKSHFLGWQVARNGYRDAALAGRATLPNGGWSLAFSSTGCAASSARWIGRRWPALSKVAKTKFA
jgi:hypothetical protein